MDFLNVARNDANLVSLFSSFHNFAPQCENAFWPGLYLSRGICKFVSVERKMRSQPSEHLLKSSPNGICFYIGPLDKLRHVFEMEKPILAR